MSEHENGPLCPPQPASADFSTLREGGRDPETGRWKAGNLAALRHGTRSRQLLNVPALAEAHAEKVRAIEADLGTDLSTLQQSAVREAARLALIVDSLGDDLLRHGVLTGKGRTRAALSAYSVALDRLHKLMATIGIERRSRRVPTTVAGIVAQLTEQERG